MRSTTFLPGIILMMLLSACASVFSGTDQRMIFKSEPEGATVYFDGLAKGTTPLELLLRKDEFKEVRISKPGYMDEIIPLQTKMDRTVILNLTVVTAHTTDAMTGAMFEYYPNAYFVTMQKKGTRKGKTSTLDRSTDYDLKSYVMSYYNIIKQQCRAGCDNTHIDTLTTLISDDYKKDKTAARKYAIKALNNSSDPLEYLKQLEADIQAPS